jgi:hypothetical protein
MPRFEAQARLSGGPVGALNPGDFPISVFPGDRVAANRVVLDYMGPAGTVYICWGLRAGGSYNNGGDLVPAHNFASAAISVPNSPGAFYHVDQAISAILLIPDTPPANYGTYIWLAHSVSDQESQFLLRAGTSQGLIDQDSGVILVLESLWYAKSMQIAYGKV